MFLVELQLELKGPREKTYMSIFLQNAAMYPIVKRTLESIVPKKFFSQPIARVKKLG